jgi:hypothetical protein
MMVLDFYQIFLDLSILLLSISFVEDFSEIRKLQNKDGSEMTQMLIILFSYCKESDYKVLDH